MGLSQRSKANSPHLRLAFVGRIHRDRGTSQFVEILKHLQLLRREIEILVVGEGPEKDNFLNELSAIGPSIKVNHLGHLEGESYAMVWNRIDILLSTAPLESYGRTIREALVSGTPVLAIESSGVIELNYALRKNWIQLISLPLQSNELIEQVETAENLEISPQYRVQLTRESQSHSSNLVLRWLEIIQASRKEGRAIEN
jgi:glycosyltransferase involved in cell wall biosynthesis